MAINARTYEILTFIKDNLSGRKRCLKLIDSVDRESFRELLIDELQRELPTATVTPASYSNASVAIEIKISGQIFKIFLKSLHSQKNHGVKNEDNWCKIIKSEILKSPKSKISIDFVDLNQQKFSIEEIRDIKNVSRLTRTNGCMNKADVLFVTENKTVPISIKMNTADYYESGDSTLSPFKELMLSKIKTDGRVVFFETLKNDKRRLSDIDNKHIASSDPSTWDETKRYIIYPNVSMKIEDEALTRKIIFGDDILLGKGAIVRNLGGVPRIKKVSDGRYEMQVSEIIPYDSVKLPEIYVIIRNEWNRCFKFKNRVFHGLRIAAVTKRRVKRALKV